MKSAPPVPEDAKEKGFEDRDYQEEMKKMELDEQWKARRDHRCF